MLHRLSLYTVHIRPDRARALEEPLFVREGFSWAAFLFGPFWAAYHRLWLAALLLLAALGLADLLTALLGLNDVSVLVVQLVLGLAAGCWGHDWRRAALRRRGFVIADIVSGESRMRAEQRFFDRHFPDFPSSMALPHAV